MDNKVGQQQQPRNRWWVFAYICIIAVFLIAIPVIIVPSLIPVYLAARGYPAGTIPDESETFQDTVANFAVLNSPIAKRQVNAPDFSDLAVVSRELEKHIGKLPRGCLNILSSIPRPVIHRGGNGAPGAIVCDIPAGSSSIGFTVRIRKRYPRVYACRSRNCFQKFFQTIREKLRKLKNIRLSKGSGISILVTVCSLDDDVGSNGTTSTSSSNTISQGTVSSNTGITNGNNPTNSPNTTVAGSTSGSGSTGEATNSSVPTVTISSSSATLLPVTTVTTTTTSETTASSSVTTTTTSKTTTTAQATTTTQSTTTAGEVFTTTVGEVSTITTQEPTTITQEPTTITQEPTTITQEPATITQEPTTITQEPTTTTTQEPTTTTTEEPTTTTTEEPTTTTTDDSMIWVPVP